MRILRGEGAVVVAAMVAALSACSSPATLRSGDVQEQIATGLADQVGGEFQVTCPTGILAEAGTTFTCSVTDTADGGTVTVVVTQSDGLGRFDWRVQAPAESPSPVASSG